MMPKALQLAPVQQYLEELYEQLAGIDSGEVASYIPELTKADPNWLGIALVTVDGHVYQVGDSREQFTIQSISKALTYGLALEDRGLDYVVGKVGVEPSGEAFNSISLEPDTGRPLNPMINAGAIATTGLIKEQPGAPAMKRILRMFAGFTGRELEIDDAVYRSESGTGHRNRAISHLLYGHGIIERPPEEALDLYFRQCSILVSARDLAMAASCLANNGVNPVTGVVALKPQYVEKVLSVMSTCGMYDYSGAWIFNVGMPAKSGVGGGIMAVLPGQFGLGVFSPRLDPKGNSVRGIEACKRLSKDFSLHLFNVARSTSASIVRKVYSCANFSSRRRRSVAEIELLAARGDRVRVYQLQGELLFGNTESLSFDMLADLEAFDYVVVDLRRVVAADRSATIVLGALSKKMCEAGKLLFYTDCPQLYQLRRYLQKRQSNGSAETPGWLAFEDTDHAVEWCENHLIKESNHAPIVSEQNVALEGQYLCSGMTQAELGKLRSTALESHFEPGAVIMRAGDSGDCLYFVLSGEVEVLVDTDAGTQLRLTTLGAGTVFGEVALVNRKRRTADVRATVATTCLQVCFDSLPDDIRTKMLVNMASHFASKIERDTELMQHLG